MSLQSLMILMKVKFTTDEMNFQPSLISYDQILICHENKIKFVFNDLMFNFADKKKNPQQSH